jgi:hypothetical protein
LSDRLNRSVYAVGRTGAQDCCSDWDNQDPENPKHDARWEEEGAPFAREALNVRVLTQDPLHATSRGAFRARHGQKYLSGYSESTLFVLS